MNAIRIRKKIESENLHLPELKSLIGKTVEIIVQEEKMTETGQIQNPYEAFFSLAGQDVVDPEAYKQLRSASQL
jgi:hypothetical protein